MPVLTLARLVCGLPSDARIIRKITKVNVSTEEILLAGILDRLSFLVWAQTEDGQKGRNRPQSMVEKLVGKQKSKSNVISFSSGEEFEAARQKILQKIGGN